MNMNNNTISAVTETPQEKARMDDLLKHLLPKGFANALDVGARFGHLAKRLADHFDSVTVLDLEMPTIQYDKIVNAQGDVTSLKFPDDSFDVIYCCEVLEHIPQDKLVRACAELSRVARHYLIIGVPYKQDIRFSRTTCRNCGAKNPPWGHVNSFDEIKLIQLFPSLCLEQTTYIGESKEITNFFSEWLMDIAENPYGTYSQDETCIKCNQKLQQPLHITLWQRIIVKLALIIINIQSWFVKPFPRWIHLMFRKN